MMNFVETKEMTATKIKAKAKIWTNDTIIAALVEALGAENVGMVRTGTSTSQKNEIGAVIGTVEVDGAEVPVAVTINVAAKPYADAPATANRKYSAFDFVAARQAYEDYFTDKELKAAEKAQAKEAKIAKDEAKRKETAEG
jgi:hypothetical protein